MVADWLPGQEGRKREKGRQAVREQKKGTRLKVGDVRKGRD